MLTEFSFRLKRFCSFSIFCCMCWLSYVGLAGAKICFVLDQDCIDGVLAEKDSESTCSADYKASKDFGIDNKSVKCEKCTEHGVPRYKCACQTGSSRCNGGELKCADSVCSFCRYANSSSDKCPATQYKYSSDKSLGGSKNGWDCTPCIDDCSYQYGKYDCQCDDTVGYWLVNNNCVKDPCYSLFEATQAGITLYSNASQISNLENMEWTCDKCSSDKQSKYAGKANCQCEGVIDPARNNRCIPQGRCDTEGYYYTRAACEKVWGQSGLCREITSGTYKYCYQGEEDRDDICPSPYHKDETVCDSYPFVAVHPTITTPHSHQPCFDCRNYECKIFEGYYYFKEECGDPEVIEIPISSSNLTSTSGGKMVRTEDLECLCPSDGPGSGKEKELNGLMYTYYDISPCCKWITKVDNDVKQILEDINSLKDKSAGCGGATEDQCWYDTFTSRGCTKRYEDEMKSIDYKWSETDKNKKEEARTHYCYFPDKDMCDIMNKCDLYKCDTAYFKIQVHSFACVSNPNFVNGTQTSDDLRVGQQTGINSNSSSSCGPGIGHSYPHESLKGWVLGETPPDISTADGMYTYMKSYTPGKWQTSSSITITADLLRQFDVQTTGNCAGEVQYGVLNVFPYVEIKCPIDRFDTGTSASKCSADSPQHSSGWEMVAAEGVFSKACVRCNKKYDCTTGYATAAQGGNSSYGTDNNYYGDDKCYRICPKAYDYDKDVSTCGTTGSNGYTLEDWSSNSHCKKCKPVDCETGYSTSVTSYGSKGYSGDDKCYRICPKAYDWDKPLSDCGDGSWELEDWSSNSHCKKCAAKPCPSGEYTYSDCQKNKGQDDSCKPTSNKSGSDQCYEIEVCNSSHPKWCPVHQKCHVNCCTDGSIEPCDPQCGGCGCTKKTNIALGSECCPDAGDTCKPTSDAWCDGTKIPRTCMKNGDKYVCAECIKDTDCVDYPVRICGANRECLAVAGKSCNDLPQR